jgi:23S rRNA pseudouridine1911/1915/1917 synthase
VTFTGSPGRLDQVVATATGMSRADAQRAIGEGRVLVDGDVRPKSHRLAGGEDILVRPGSDRPLAPSPDAVVIRYEDEHLAVVSKPAGVVTHPTPARREETLVNRLLGMGMPLAPAGGPDRPGIVHRLDAGTSGLLIVAKDDEASGALQAMFRSHAVERTYLALARGEVRPDRFLIDAPLERDRARIRVGAVGGRHAATDVAVVERFVRASLLEVRPRTGRTHQIRVHLAAVGHPVLGDRAYGGGGDDARALGLERPFLHSWRVAFVHPLTGERVEVEDPLPGDLEGALERARGGGSVP